MHLVDNVHPLFYIGRGVDGFVPQGAHLVDAVVGGGVQLQHIQKTAALQPQASQTVNTLRRSYESYRTAAELARTTLEVNLHQVELVIAAQGGVPAHGAGYVPPDAEPPQNMKTDFRA